MGKRILLSLVGAALLFHACGTEKKDLSQGKPRGRTQPQPSTPCPKVPATDLQEFTLRLAAAAPIKLAVEMGGERKFDECRAPAEKPPLVKLERGSRDTLIVTLEHWGAFDYLPRETSFTVYDLGNCEVGASPRVLFAVDRQPVEFRREYPNGTACSARLAARVSLSQGEGAP